MTHIHFITNTEELKDAYRAIKRSAWAAFDVETTGLDPYRDRVVLWQIAVPEGVFVLLARPLRGTEPLRKTLALLTEREVIGHNLAFEYQFLYRETGLELRHTFDTLLAERLLTAGRNDIGRGLGDVLRRRLNVKVVKDLQTSFVGLDPETWEPSPEQLEYAAKDVLYLERLRAVQRAMLADEALLPVMDLETSVLPIFARMELAGLHLDVERHQSVLDQVEATATGEATALHFLLDPVWQRHESRIIETREVQYTERLAAVQSMLWSKSNPTGTVGKGTAEAKALYKWRDEVKPPKPRPLSLTSRPQMLTVLRYVTGLSEEQLPNMKKQTLLPLLRDNPVLARYAVWVKADKVLTSFGTNLWEMINPVTGRVHPHYTQVISTGRTSSNNPNGQQMPAAIRACFIPAPGHRFVVADFANMELRIGAGLSGDPTMIDAFRHGWDLHSMTAAAAWPGLFATWQDVPKDGEHRKNAKIGNFATFYGGSAYALAWRGLVPSLEIAERIQEGFKLAYPVAWDWVNRQGEQALQTLHAVTASGRKRYFKHPGPRPRYSDIVLDPETEKPIQAIRLWEKRRKRIKRQAMNHPIQGTGADIAKRAMALIDQRLRDEGLRGRIVAMVHDELLLEAPAEEAARTEAIVAEAMVQAGAEYVPNVAIPADTHVVDRWQK